MSSQVPIDGPPLFTWSECDPAREQPNEYIVEGLIRRRCSNLILSPPKKGKSQLSAHIVACLVSGQPVFGCYEVDPSFEPRVLVLLTEETRFKFRARVEANLRGLAESFDEARVAA